MAHVTSCLETRSNGITTQMGSPDAQWLAPQAHVECPYPPLIQMGLLRVLQFSPTIQSHILWVRMIGDSKLAVLIVVNM